jgi:hypothetical protein
LHNAEDKGLVNEGCYGSRPGKEAGTLVLMETMQMEISRSSRKPFIKFDNDATPCYDRIVPSMALLISRKYGLHRNVAAVCGNTLADAHYKIKAMLGVSEDDYSHCKAYPIYGTGQGSRNYLTCWLLICSTLFNCFETQAYGASYESVDRETTVRLYMAGFVDDNAGQVNIFGSPEPSPPEVLLERMQHNNVCSTMPGCGLISFGNPAATWSYPNAPITLFIGTSSRAGALLFAAAKWDQLLKCWTVEAIW